MAVGSLNRFLSIDGAQHEQLVVVPGQYRAGTATTPTVGTERLYRDLQFDVYYAPFDATDFAAPAVWQASTSMTTDNRVAFDAFVTDDSGSVARVVVLYRLLTSQQWSKVELSYDPLTQHATGFVAGLGGRFEYFVQAVDPTGNVALALDHSLPFQGQAVYKVYLPLARR